MTHRHLAPVAAGALLVACSSGSTPPGVSDRSPSPVPSVSGYPGDSAAIPAVRVKAEPGDLLVLGNHEDARVATASGRATVPAGATLRVTAACSGPGSLVVTSRPQSSADLEISCADPSGAPSELGVIGDEPVAVDTTFEISVRGPVPGRWQVVVGADR